jgi:hypothetical protein
LAKGTFSLAKSSAAAVSRSRVKLTPTVEESEESEEQYEIVSSFGMFWRREAVQWATTPKLLGMQQLGATPVDFNKQLGIYLLYDGREVIYIGRTTDRPLGKPCKTTPSSMPAVSLEWHTSAHETKPT